MKPESRFITSVNAKIPKTVHREKMHNVYRGGTFDVWYSGSKADLWIEYKWIPRVPARGRAVPDMSPLQLQWGKGRLAEGRSVLVVVGCPGGAAMLRPDQWEAGVTAEEFRRALVTKSALAAWIHRLVQGDDLDASGTETSRRGAGNRKRVQDPADGHTDIRAAQVQSEAPHRGLGGD
jgi:hypothetical protein